jgi:3-oxoacyl-[acyl-carrier protein] reductase
MFDLSGKVALVTGGSRGIGRAVCLALAGRGAYVVVGYVQGEAQASETLAKLVEAGGKGETLRVDASEFAESEDAVIQVAKKHGRLDVLVVSAGISLDALLIRMKEEDLDRTLAVNLKGAIAAAKGALKAMVKQRKGRIIFISSVIGEAGNPGQTAYAASKAALLGVTKSLAREYAARNVAINAITPGYVRTDMTGALSEEQRAAMLASVPMGRPAEAEEVAAAVVFLASDEAEYITGQTLRVNGGMYM